MLTVSELAQELGVTPQAVYKRINGDLKLSLKKYIQKGKGGKIVIATEGAELIKQSFKPSLKPVDNDAGNQFKDAFKESLEKVQIERIEDFKRQIESLNQQIERQQSSIEHLQRQNEALVQQNENSQRIIFTMQTQQKLIEAPASKGWFSRFKKDSQKGEG